MHQHGLCLRVEHHAIHLSGILIKKKPQ
jgi:hypothetical protein